MLGSRGRQQPGSPASLTGHSVAPSFTNEASSSGTGREGSPAPQSPAAGAHAVEGAAAGQAGAAPSTAAASDLSRLSMDSHHSLHSLHSIHSTRSRWSTTATVNTVLPGRHTEAFDPEPVPEEFSSSGSSAAGDGDVAAAAGRHSHLQAGPGGPRAATAAGNAQLNSGSSRGRPAHWHPLMQAEAGSGSHVQPPAASQEMGPAAAAAAAAAAAGRSTADAGAAGSSATNDSRLPPRLIVFNPDGGFGIGVDPLRAKELQQAAEAAAERRRRVQQRAASAGPPGRPPGRGGEDGSNLDVLGGPDVDELGASFPGWRQTYMRHKFVLIALLALDMLYLFVLLLLRLLWDDTEEPTNHVVKFFVGSHPSETSISYLAGSLFTDAIAMYGATQNYASVITLFIVWSVVLGAFAFLEMPLLFMIMRLMLLIAAFQLRFSMSRLRNMLPPSGLGAWIAEAARGIGSAGSSAWRSATRPFRRGAHRQHAGTDGGSSSAATAISAAAAAAERGEGVGGAGAGGAAETPTSSAAAAQLRAARSSALFRAAVARMMAEQQQAQQAQQAQQGSIQRDAEAGGSSSGAGSSSSSDGARVEWRVVVPPQGPTAAGPVPSSAEQSNSLDRLYSRIMDDIAAVAASPSSSLSRQLQRRRERDRQQRAMAGEAAAGAARTASRSRSQVAQRAGALEGGGRAGSRSEGDSDTSGDEAGLPGSSRSGGRGRSGSVGGSGASPDDAISHATVAAQDAAGLSGPGPEGIHTPPTWQDLVLLLSYHSQQEQLRRQRQQTENVVPLVHLEAPPPL